jgi:hypothetical protein
VGINPRWVTHEQGHNILFRSKNVANLSISTRGAQLPYIDYQIIPSWLPISVSVRATALSLCSSMLCFFCTFLKFYSFECEGSFAF